MMCVIGSSATTKGDPVLWNDCPISTDVFAMPDPVGRNYCGRTTTQQPRSSRTTYRPTPALPHPLTPTTTKRTLMLSRQPTEGARPALAGAVASALP